MYFFNESYIGLKFMITGGSIYNSRVKLIFDFS